MPKPERKRIFVKVPVGDNPTWASDEDVRSHPKSWSDYEWMFEVPVWATDDDIKGFILLMDKYADWSEAEDEELEYWRGKDRDHGDGRYH
jgi:hypothetical protein